MALRATFAIAAVSGLLFVLRQLPLDRWLSALTDPLLELGPWAPVAFGGLYVVATLLLVPGSLITAAVGAVFGIVLGTAVVSVASTLSAGLSFLIARHLARDSVRRRIEQSPKLLAIDEAIGREGWKIVGLMRLTPLVPFGPMNYLSGITSIPFWQFLLTSWLAMFPGTLMYVYLGSIGKEAISDREATAGDWVFRGLGLLATVAVTILISRMAQRAVRSRLPEASNNDDAPGATPRDDRFPTG
jgi:uncharacterized membrane protein YdjX (TVP38/TMEM64 family)